MLYKRGSQHTGAEENCDKGPYGLEGGNEIPSGSSRVLYRSGSQHAGTKDQNDNATQLPQLNSYRPEA
ncbi:Hypp1947 [Branchiostoma lanceolatum]|uniref:Hypp1947 protein n=1 Tax=Branchiostoma lanceolatum TaxID=7740 RepID=A0A8K0EN16_BRALA|nr:Hypp1947 [Branchiostoma lanceolatum]